MATICLVDASVLCATVDRGAFAYRATVEVLGRGDLTLVVPALAVAEAFYLIGSRFGSRVEARFARGLADLDIVAPTPADCVRMAELIERYSDLPLGGTDASIVALAERLGTTTVATLDRRHFSVVQTIAGHRFQILPESTD